MPIEEALALIRKSAWRGIGRRNWRAVLRFVAGELVLCWPSGATSLWAPTQADLIVEDWELRG